MAITAKDVNELRQMTGLGMMECKKALEETGGDKQKAMDLLRTRGLAKMDARADRVSAEGRIAAVLSADKSKGAIVEVNTETDFVAKTDTFQKMVQSVAVEVLKQPAGEVQKNDAIQKLIDEIRLTSKENVQFGRGTVIGGSAGGDTQTVVGSYVHFTGKIGALVQLAVPCGSTVTDDLLRDLCQHVVAIVPAPLAIDESGVPAEVLEKEKQIAKAQAMEQGKPENIAEKMVAGKIRKFCEDHCLSLQLFIKPDEQGKQHRVKEILPKGVQITGFVRYQMGVK